MMERTWGTHNAERTTFEFWRSLLESLELNVLS